MTDGRSTLNWMLEMKTPQWEPEPLHASLLGQGTAPQVASEEEPKAVILALADESDGDPGSGVEWDGMRQRRSIVEIDL